MAPKTARVRLAFSADHLRLEAGSNGGEAQATEIAFPEPMDAQSRTIAEEAMPRPTTPILSKAIIVTAAIELIDDVGIDKFSIHALARRLNVRGPSIYYYFHDRDELFAAVGLTLLQDVKVPKRRAKQWSDWLVQDAVAYYRAVRSHPNAAPILYEVRTRAGAAARLNEALEYLQRCGIEPGDGLAMIDSFQALALGWVVFGQADPASRSADNLDALRYPELSAAEKKHKYDEASFRRTIVAVIAGFEKMYMADAAAQERRNGHAW